MKCICITCRAEYDSIKDLENHKRVIHQESVVKMSHQNNDPMLENIGLFFHGAISNITTFADEVSKNEIIGLLTRSEVEYLNKLVKATEEFLKDEREPNNASIS